MRGGSVVTATDGVMITDADGNRFFDLTGSYGVNVFGYDFYKTAITQGSELVRDLVVVFVGMANGIGLVSSLR